MKRYVVAEEIINGRPSGYYTIRLNTDVNLCRFMVIKSFDTYEEAFDYLMDIREFQKNLRP